MDMVNILRFLISGLILLLPVSGSVFTALGDAPLTMEGIVGVTGAKMGSGRIIRVEGRPKILTNAHLLQGKSSATVYFPRLLTDFNVDVDFQDAVADVAILSVPKDPDFFGTYLEEVAQDSTSFVKGLVQESIPSWMFPPSKEVYTLEVVLDHERKSIPSVKPWKFLKSDDQFISGFFSKLIIAPFFARTGMSGGSLFSNHAYLGMVSHVDLGGALNTYVIPAQEIAKVISYHVLKGSKGLTFSGEMVSEVKWIEERESNLSLQVNLMNGTSIEVSGRAGRTGVAGGGEHGSGSEDLRGGSYWNLEMVRNDGLKGRAEIVNPFESGTRIFRINGDEIKYFKTKKKFQAATFARYIWLLQKVSPGQFATVKTKDLSVSDLGLARINHSKSVAFVRSFRRVAANRFDMIAGVGSRNRDGSQSLFPEKNILNEEARLGLAPKPITLFDNSEVDEEGFHFGVPVSARRNKEDWVDIRFQDPRPSHKKIFIRASHGLSTLGIWEDGKATFLEPKNSLDSVSLIFETQAGRYQAILIYDESDLARLERAFVLTPDYLFEFLGCEPGLECWR